MPLVMHTLNNRKNVASKLDTENVSTDNRRSRKIALDSIWKQMNALYIPLKNLSEDVSGEISDTEAFQKETMDYLDKTLSLVSRLLGIEHCIFVAINRASEASWIIKKASDDWSNS